MVLSGIDQIGDYPQVFSGKRLGLITTPAAVDAHLISGIQLLHKKYGLTALFGPEHGVRGDCDAGAEVAAYNDPDTGIPVYSLYRKDSKRLTDEMLELVDAVIYDIPDVGTRYYTFISTLLYALEDCARAGKELILLDRPNPLGGEAVEGNLPEDAFRSFVGCYPLCIRYGLTAGETAAMMNRERGLGCRLTVLPCRGWERRMLFPETGLLWMMPSLGIPRFGTALLYPGACLAEGTNLSEGRGTSCPFEIIGAPYVCPQELADEMSRRKLPGVLFTPAYFTPSASKHAGQKCGGIQLHISDPHAFAPVRTGVELLDAVRRLYPEDFAFLPPPKENGRAFISLLAGGGVFCSPNWDKDAVLSGFEVDSSRFRERKQAYHLYD